MIYFGYKPKTWDNCFDSKVSDFILFKRKGIEARVKIVNQMGGRAKCFCCGKVCGDIQISVKWAISMNEKIKIDSRTDQTTLRVCDKCRLSIFDLTQEKYWQSGEFIIDSHRIMVYFHGYSISREDIEVSDQIIACDVCLDNKEAVLAERRIVCSQSNRSSIRIKASLCERHYKEAFRKICEYLNPKGGLK